MWSFCLAKIIGHDDDTAQIIGSRKMEDNYDACRRLLRWQKNFDQFNPVKTADVQCSMDRILAIKYSRVHKRWYTAGDDQIIRSWRPTEKHGVQQVKEVLVSHSISCLALDHPRDELLLAGTFASHVYVICAKEMKLLRSLENILPAAVLCCQVVQVPSFHEMEEYPDADEKKQCMIILAGVSNSIAVCLYDYNAHEVVATVSHDTRAIAWVSLYMKALQVFSAS